MINPRSLQQRTLFFILVPTFILLLSMSVVGYIFVRTVLLNQWGETAIAKLQRTAHQIDMRLRKPKELLLLLHNRQGVDIKPEILSFIIQEIERIEGVVSANIEWPNNDLQNQSKTYRNHPMMDGMHLYKMDKLTVSSPQLDSQENNRTISLESELKSQSNNAVGKVKVVMSFDSLINEIMKAPWWKSNKAYLIDDSGNVLVSTSSEANMKTSFTHNTFDSTDELEQNTLIAMAEDMYGTVFGPGSPPEEISGFYRLSEAPWTMVVIAPGEEVLHPIIRFKMLYILSFTLCIFVVLLTIRGTMSRITKSIKNLSSAADDLAHGNFGPPLSVSSHDEVGELTQSFNKMTSQLKQRLFLKEAMNIAREVQQNLLRNDFVSVKGIVARGAILYCDETGGDYFDILKFPKNDKKVGIAVGDVVGHGIGAALLMTTVRALLRCRLAQPGNLSEIMCDINKLLCQDTMKSGNFVTLFYLEVDHALKKVSWIRAGHDPAIVYCPMNGEFSELKGPGLALGVDENFQYEYSEQHLEQEEILILIASDGAWEVANKAGDQFGKERMRKILADSCSLPPDIILDTLIRDINTFRGNNPQEDDITLALLKID